MLLLRLTTLHISNIVSFCLFLSLSILSFPCLYALRACPFYRLILECIMRHKFDLLPQCCLLRCCFLEEHPLPSLYHFLKILYRERKVWKSLCERNTGVAYSPTNINNVLRTEGGPIEVINQGLQRVLYAPIVLHECCKLRGTLWMLSLSATWRVTFKWKWR